MDPVIITPDDVAEAVRRAPNWKSPGLDRLHHYWLMVCHAVLARQFQEALNQKSLPSLFTTGITHLVPKDQLRGKNMEQAKISSQELMNQLNLANKALWTTSDLPEATLRRLQIGCALCGNPSLVLLDEPTSGLDVEYRREIWDMLLISRLERVCAACWRSATREFRDQHDSNRPSLSEAILPDVGSSSDLNIPEPPPLPQQNLHTTHVRSNPTITSSVYKRAASTSKHCIFVNCFETERLLVPSSKKDLLLLNNKFYVPPAARICLHHLDHGRWSELTSQLKDFTGSQFDSIMRIMQ
ncbi:unnamed protein product [Parnassius apollo]|uniref:(apollo) hypothetical protein n=1 Tax=Parnassius apollo TaxID=110799 RepID=A0A8S3WW32_PARAO|nr:unnamed protein product [Parnassius apollo]